MILPTCRVLAAGQQDIRRLCSANRLFSSAVSQSTHNGRDDCGGGDREQQLLDETVAIVERFHQGALLPGTLHTVLL